MPVEKKRSVLKQADVPSCSIEEALRVPAAILDHHAGDPTTPLKVAAALDLQPSAGRFRMLCSCSAAYGFTSGSAWSETISVEDRARRILSPTVEGSELSARREALFAPRIFKEFLSKYSGSPIPRTDIGCNVLVEMGVPKPKTEEVFERLVGMVSDLGLLQEIKGRQYVDLDGPAPAEVEEKDDPSLREDRPADSPGASEVDTPRGKVPPSNGQTKDSNVTNPVSEQRKKRVFVTHGKDKSFIEPIKKLLSFGELEAVLAVEKQTVAQPVPDKVMQGMRSCGAAIIHVADELRLLDQQANEHLVLNSNVLIEIGAAMALYGRRFILLVKEGVTLPSNLQGLYEVRYDGDSLDGNATIRLLEAINDIKNHPLPGN